MGNGSYNDHFQYKQQNLNNNNNNNNNIQKSTFLPMLCSRCSIKDVPSMQRLGDRSASFSNDPLSPKIGCMGQVKRNNKINGFPSTTTHTHNKLALISKSTSSDFKYFKLKRLFSAKNIATNNNNGTSGTVSSCRRGREVCNINIADMDPPLPVIKRVPKPPADHHGGGDENKNNLWKRRSNGVGALKSLELQHIKIPRHQVEIQTV